MTGGRAGGGVEGQEDAWMTGGKFLPLHMIDSFASKHTWTATGPTNALFHKSKGELSAV